MCSWESDTLGKTRPEYFTRIYREYIYVLQCKEVGQSGAQTTGLGGSHGVGFFQLQMAAAIWNSNVQTLSKKIWVLSLKRTLYFYFKINPASSLPLIFGSN